MAHICTHHFQNVGVQDEKSLSCFQVVSSHWALEYAEAMGKPCRFLNMTPEQIARRKERRRKQKWRAVKKKEKKRRGVKHSKKSDCSKENKASVSEHSIEQRKLRPCCGRRHDKCTCEPLPGMRTECLSMLAKRYVCTPLNTVKDTTDVSAFQEVLGDLCKKLPIAAVLTIAFIHVVFNQRHLLEAMVEEKVFAKKKPWVHWDRLTKVIRAANAKGRLIRSSNYYNATLRRVVLQSRHKSVKAPHNPVERDVLACRIIGQDSLPHAICELYEAKPSRDLWKGMLQEWMQQASSRASGAFGHYYMKCCLDRLFSVRQICHGTISWWPTECPSYKKWYRILYPHQRLDDDSKFQILCAIYLKLNTIATSGNCSFPNALAQTCWDLKEKDGRLALTC